MSATPRERGTRDTGHGMGALFCTARGKEATT